MMKWSAFLKHRISLWKWHDAFAVAAYLDTHFSQLTIGKTSGRLLWHCIIRCTNDFVHEIDSWGNKKTAFFWLIICSLHMFTSLERKRLGTRWAQRIYESRTELLRSESLCENMKTWANYTRLPGSVTLKLQKLAGYRQTIEETRSNEVVNSSTQE